MECRLDRITVHYEAFGEGRPLVVLPGWPDPWQVPADYLEPLFDRRSGWRRMYLDLPGRGETPGEPWITKNDQVLEIVLDVIDRLIPDQRFVIAGHSAGAHLARAVVQEREERMDGLLQVVPVIGDEKPPDQVTLEADDELIRRIAAESGEVEARDFADFFVVQKASVYEALVRIRPSLRTADKAFLDRLDDRISRPVDPPITPFAKPTLFVLGRQDSVVGYRGAFALMDGYPRATVAVLDRAGHGLPWEQPELFAALVSDWLDRVEQEGWRPPEATRGP
jgi:pimeloyl-ACP methyl ester carboxylesterase